MGLITITVAVAILASGALVFFLAKEAVGDGNWSQLRSMASEFVAVFAAFALATWLSIEERKAERREQADALFLAAENFAVTLARSAAMPRTALEMPPLTSPSIFETLFSSAEVHVFHSLEAFVLIEKATNLRALLSETPSVACRLTSPEYAWIIAVVERNETAANNDINLDRLTCFQDRINNIDRTIEIIRVVACSAPRNDDLLTLEESLGSRLIDGHSQKMTAAAKAMADRKTLGQRS